MCASLASASAALAGGRPSPEVTCTLRRPGTPPGGGGDNRGHSQRVGGAPPGTWIPALGFAATGLLSTYYTLDRFWALGTPWWTGPVPPSGGAPPEGERATQGLTGPRSRAQPLPTAGAPPSPPPDPQP